MAHNHYQLDDIYLNNSIQGYILKKIKAQSFGNKNDLCIEER